MQFRSGNLKPVSRLGAGQFGTVYLAEDQLHGKVAVKLIARRPTELDPQWEERGEGLLSEGSRLKAAEHQNVVRVFDVRQTDDGNAVLLVMEYCAGGSCEQPYRAGPLPVHRVQSVMLDTALGLKAVHARGMLHRDIKPANILIAEGDRAKLGDFGLVTEARVHGYAKAAGYLDHLAFEFFKNRKTSERTDVWAFGMTTYRLLHGRAFYEALPQPQHSVPRGRFGPKLPWLPHIPKSWRRYVRKTLHDDPSRRVQNADDLFAGLSKLPNSPSWECDYSAPQVRWSRPHKNRLWLVEWDRPSQRKHAWRAVSLPISGHGPRRPLGGSSQPNMNRKEAQRELEEFFARYET